VIRGVVRLLALAVVVAGAVQLGFNLTDDDLPEEDSADAGFARDMRAHHAQGVEMAELLRDRTQNEDLRVVATDIALTQQAQIGQMRGWLDVWELPPTSTDPPMAWADGDGEGDGGGSAEDGESEMPGLASESDLAELSEARGEHAEELFLQLMIRHHEGGVHMALLAVDRVQEGEVQALARTIAESQQAEIRYLTALLGARDAEALPSILPEDLTDLADGTSDDDASESGWDLVGRWWLVGVGGVVLLALGRDLTRRPQAARPTIAPEEGPIATVGEASDDHADRHPDRSDDRKDEPERFPSDDSGFDDL
jgi:uncharacterized protein (DUF305 family)